MRAMAMAVLLLLLAGITGLPQNAVRERRSGAADQGLHNKILGGFGSFEEGAGFLLLDGFLLVEAVVKKGDLIEPGIFLLNTGSRAECRIEKWFAEKLKWSDKEKITLKLGPSYLDDLIPRLGDCPRMRDLSKRRATILQGSGVCGSIGYGALSGKKLFLDYRTFRLKLLPAAGGAAGGKKEPADEAEGEDDLAIPFTDKAFPLCLEVTINSKVTVPFQLNTSCPASWVEKGVASQAGWRKGKSPVSFRSGKLELVDESLLFAFRKRKQAEDAEAGDDPSAGETVAAEPSPAGVLGNDFLRRFQVTVDAVDRVVLLERIGPRQAGGR